jgi:hypothetical protein
MSHIHNQIHKKPLSNDNTLHVIGVVSNPSQYHSRYRLAREWLERMQNTENVEVHLVETAFGDRQHELSADLNLRTSSPIWIKESMINLGVRGLLPLNWKYVAWVDCDITFMDPHWAQKTLHELQHHHVVQPWRSCSDMNAHGSVLQNHQSFGFLHQAEIPKQRWAGDPYSSTHGHPGYAWAATRTFWEASGGLIDWGILGSSDHHMAWGMIRNSEATIHRAVHSNFFRRLKEWENRAVRITHNQVGYVEGHISHFWHGQKKNRKYRERWQILIDHKFDPVADIIHDAQGLIQLVGKHELAHAIHSYNRSRQEDSIDE